MDDWESDVADQPNLVRPYTLTAGRTAARVQLPLEAPIGKLPNGEAATVAGKRCAGPDPHHECRPALCRRGRRRVGVAAGRGPGV